MSGDRVLPIDRAPAAQFISPEDLGHLNAAFYLVQLRQSEARELEARGRLAIIEAERSLQGFALVRQAVAAKVGVAPEGLRWDLATGEVVPEARRA